MIELSQLFDGDIGFGNKFSDTVAKKQTKSKNCLLLCKQKGRRFVVKRLPLYTLQCGYHTLFSEVIVSNVLCLP